MDINGDPLETEIWERSNGLLLGATTSTGYVKEIVITPHIVHPEPRTFINPKPDGSTDAARVAVMSHHRIVIGNEEGDPARDWRDRRAELAEALRLAERREFVQYFGNSDGASDRVRALEDVRYLISQHGAEGVDLWDPYLSAQDLLDTLFWSSSWNAPLRAITNGNETQERRASVYEGQTYSQIQHQRLQACCGNRFGLNLEFRIRSGAAGWSFHDRFLIFPNRTDGPLAWSLGTSVNSIGKAHHILQKVSNAALIAGAFKSLWSALNDDQHLIWKC